MRIYFDTVVVIYLVDHTGPFNQRAMQYVPVYHGRLRPGNGSSRDVQFSARRLATPRRGDRGGL